MSLLWVQAARMSRTASDDEEYQEFINHPHTMWHGTASGDIGSHPSPYGIHVGTREAAEQALHARIGRPHEGSWDGTREYGKTLLGHQRSGYEINSGEPRLPSGNARGGNGEPIHPASRPNIHPVRIVGPMSNTRHTPHEDFKANGLMAGQIKRGRAKSGYFYENVGEDVGSISAVVPHRNHLQTFEEYQARKRTP